MKVCVVSSCQSNTVNNPDLSFFNLPRDKFLKEEWMELLSLGRRDVSDQVRVCELHFKPKDFSAGKRQQLKHQAVPSVRMGRGKKLANNSSDDDEFMHCDSDSDPEILEVKKISREMATTPQTPVPSQDVKPKIEEEPTPEPECGSARRSSRRAARVAAEKITNVVRKLGLSEEASFQPKNEVSKLEKVNVRPQFDARQRFEARPKAEGRSKTKDFLAINVPLPQIDLLMECHEELLSAVQAEALLKAQLEYNMVMKRLRTLKAANARIICALSDEPEQPTNGSSSPSVVVTPTAPVPISRSPNIVITPIEKAKPASAPVSLKPKTAAKSIFPVELRSAVLKPAASSSKPSYAQSHSTKTQKNA